MSPSGRSSALEPREPPFASVRAPQAIDGPLCHCPDHAARPAAGSSCVLLSFVITTSTSLSSFSQKAEGLVPKRLRCSACSSPTICKLHVGAWWVRSGVGMHSQHNTPRV